MVAERAEVAFGVGEQTVVDQTLNQLALEFQRSAGNVHQFVDAGKQAGFVVFVNKAQTRTVESDDADR